MDPAGGVSAARGRDRIWRVHAALVVVQCLYSGANVISKVALTTGVNPIVFAVYRDGAAICALAPVAYFAERRKRPPLDWTTVGLFASIGLIAFFAGQLCLLFGIKLATASLASVVAITTPVGLFFISLVFGLEDINWRRFDGQAKIGGLVCAVIGGVVTASYKGTSLVGGTVSPVSQSGLSSVLMQLNGMETWQIGVILLFLSGLSISVSITLQVPTLKRYPAPISMAAFASFFGFLALGIVGLVTVQENSEWYIFDEPSVIIATFYKGVVVAGATIALQAWAIQQGGAVLAASYPPLQLFITSSLSLIFLGEKIYFGSVLGALLIVCGLYVITLGQVKSGKLVGKSGAVLLPGDGLPTSKVASNLQKPLLA